MSDTLSLSLDDDMDEESPLCPKCDDPMVLRRNRLDGSTFWGCSNYPTCKGTVSADSDYRNWEYDDEAEADMWNAFEPNW